ncbi:MAG: GNAT family N-acetyltransferase [Allomuricauda sp.]|uniref:N-acetyltransferase domain-containing protein n=1 Tax=Flagellimonas profundi TaxID=2915620 RepID=A0ABS3FC82_9FLAO|nr:GNAT family N-acetyltransferase [Allomuricauda profundi]MBO0340552.1 hypothetical protein [Allomuricauda profundi]
MKIEKNKKVSGFDRYWGIVRNGLFLLGLRNRLAKLGIDVAPYYWVQEETEPCAEPIIKDDATYTVRYLNQDELRKVCHLEPGEDYDRMMEGVEKGQLIIGLETSNKIAAYTFVELNDFDFKGRRFELGPNEAYLLNMWTFHEYRGKNLAPYLRYQAYQLLREKGIDVKYSITNYFNKSSIKFKNKLNSKHLYLYLCVVLFKRYTWNFTLRKY